MGSCASTTAAYPSASRHVQVQAAPEKVKVAFEDSPLETAFSTLLVGYGCLNSGRNLIVSKDVKEALHYMTRSIHETKESFTLWLPQPFGMAEEYKEQMYAFWQLLQISNAT